MNGFGQGVKYLRQGFTLITEPKLRLFVIIPLLINIVLFVVGVYLAGHWFAQLMNYFMGWLPSWEWLGFLRAIFWVLYAIIVLLVFTYTFVVFANLIGSPFYSYLAELTQRQLTGVALEDMESPWGSILKSIPRSVYREFRKIAYYLPRALGLLILGFIPVINIFAGVAWFLFSAWMMNLQYLDYPAENNRTGFDELRKQTSLKRSSAFGFGGVVYLASLIPVINLFVMPAAVCGATAKWVEEFSSKKKAPTKS
ncbi:MAG: sulfate transporter CysZ [Arenicella sp.]